MTMLPSCDLKDCYSGPDTKQFIKIEMDKFGVFIYFCSKEHKSNGYNMIKDLFSEFV